MWFGGFAVPYVSVRVLDGQYIRSAPSQASVRLHHAARRYRGALPSRNRTIPAHRRAGATGFLTLPGRGAAAVLQAEVLDHAERADREGLCQHEGDAE